MCVCVCVVMHPFMGLWFWPRAKRWIKGEGGKKAKERVDPLSWMSSENRPVAVVEKYEKFVFFWDPQIYKILTILNILKE